MKNNTELYNDVNTQDPRGIYMQGLSLSKSRAVKGQQPLKLIPALTTRASKRMKTHRFSHYASFVARERM